MQHTCGRETADGTGTDPVGFYEFPNLPPGNYIVDAGRQTVESPSTPGLFGTMVATTGSTAPFVGLLGTVVGIINSFQGLAGDGGGGLGAVAGGISEALFATAVGLLVAIPAVMAFNAFNARVDGFKIDMNDVASELIDFVLKEGRY